MTWTSNVKTHGGANPSPVFKKDKRLNFNRRGSADHPVKNGTDKMNKVRTRVYNRLGGRVSPTETEYAGMVIQVAQIYVYYNDGGGREVRFKAGVCLPSPDMWEFENLLDEVKEQLVIICECCDTHEEILDNIGKRFNLDTYGYILSVKEGMRLYGNSCKKSVLAKKENNQQ